MLTNLPWKLLRLPSKISGFSWGVLNANAVNHARNQKRLPRSYIARWRNSPGNRARPGRRVSESYGHGNKIAILEAETNYAEAGVLRRRRFDSARLSPPNSPLTMLADAAMAHLMQI